MMELTLVQAEHRIEEQKEYFASNETKDISFRIKQLKRLKSAIKNDEEHILKALKLDLGKHEAEAYATEVGFVYKSIDDAIKNIKKWAKPQLAKTPFYMLPALSYSVYEPYGSVLIIGPFNYPFQLVMEPLVGVIAAGNCAVIKPSELTPNVSKIIAHIIKNAFESKYISCVEGSVPTTTALLQTKFDYIFFTGSPAVGKIVMKAAAENLIPVTLELGGKSPAIVDESADLRNAAKRIIWGKNMNVGQTCIEPDYVYVHESVRDELIKEMKLVIVKYYGDDILHNDDYGRIVNNRHMQRLISILEGEKENIIYGGHYIEKERFVEPTLISASSWNSPSMEEEIFGPILPILTYHNLDDVIKEVNGHDKPLALYIFSKRKEVQKKLLNETSSGGTCINDVIMHTVNTNLGFGGVGNSGIGRYHGKDSFLTFSHKKSVFDNRGNLSAMLSSPPYSDWKTKMIRKVMR